MDCALASPSRSETGRHRADTDGSVCESGCQLTKVATTEPLQVQTGTAVEVHDLDAEFPYHRDQVMHALQETCECIDDTRIRRVRKVFHAGQRASAHVFVEAGSTRWKPPNNLYLRVTELVLGRTFVSIRPVAGPLPSKAEAAARRILAGTACALSDTDPVAMWQMSGTSIESDLQDLRELRAAGSITEGFYQALRQELLERI